MSAFNKNDEDWVRFQDSQTEQLKMMVDSIRELSVLNNNLFHSMQQLIKMNRILIAKIQIPDNKTIH